MSVRDQILAADDLPTERAQTPEWADAGVPHVYLRTLTGAERDAWESEVVRIRGDKAEARFDNARAKLLVRCVVDQGGERVFGDSDAGALGGKNSRVLSRLYKRAARLNGIGEDDVEELVKNSGDGPSDAPGSG